MRKGMSAVSFPFALGPFPFSFLESWAPISGFPGARTRYRLCGRSRGRSFEGVGSALRPTTPHWGVLTSCFGAAGGVKWQCAAPIPGLPERGGEAMAGVTAQRNRMTSAGAFRDDPRARRQTWPVQS